ncbi:MAG: 2-oxoglutarate oxidoreductase [Deltaproteobacteria bacterium]|jgi:2-oxoglutarate ferredoxin oxidoreductase subunit beta|nr:2-oxoglutarate oxidoreductase [Deltaproteobacteria bacterium]
MEKASDNLSSLYGKTLFLDKLFSYCPGCGHGIVTRLVAETIEAMGIREKTVSVVGIGCGGFSHHYMDIDAIEAMHGRSPSVATGFKLASPENFVFTYQGDGDMSAIGLADLLHAANKGLPITCLMINNTVFGMTGGQMSPTSLPGQVTATTQKGRDPHIHGYPILVPEMMLAMPGVKYLARESVADAPAIRRAGKSLRRAFECQEKNLGFAFIEFIVPCPTGLKKSVLESYDWCKNQMTAYFKPAVFIDQTE